jgi:uncharacterized membrane protein
MTTRILGLALLVTFAWSGITSAQNFVNIPNSWASAVTPDGEIVVGNGPGGGYYWKWKTDPAPTVIGGNSAVAISDDGTVIVGSINDPVTGDSVAGRWTQATGWLSLGFLPNSLSCPSKSNAYDVSADGSTVVGLSWDGCSGRGFIWTLATGMQELQVLGNGGNRATAISADGSAIGGFAQGSFSRTPAYWQPDLSGQLIDINEQGEAYNFTADGSLSVGTMYQGSTSGWYSAYSRTSGGVITNLGSLNSNMAGTAKDVTEDGSFIVGYDVAGLTREAWLWTAGSGIISLDSVLASMGFAGTDTFVCSSVSDDGNVVVGGHSNNGGFADGYIVEFNSTPWVDLGGGTAGALGQPVFEASGDLTAGSTLNLDLFNAPPSAIFLMWISLSSSPANVVGGTLYPLPADAKLVLATNPLGEFNIATAVAAGAPSDVDLWFQCIVQDATNVNGITLSNCMRGTTP